MEQKQRKSFDDSRAFRELIPNISETFDWLCFEPNKKQRVNTDKNP